MSTTTETPAAGAPSKDPTAPTTRIRLPGFGQARTGPPASTPNATVVTPEGLAPRDPGSSPGPGRTPTTAPSPSLFGSPGEIGDASSDYDELDTPRRGISGRRTTSSNGEGPTTKDLAAAIAGVLFVITGFAAWSLARTRRWELRTPDEAERLAVANPLARIAARHAGAEWLTPDLVDGVQAAVGVAAYAKTDPLTRTDRAERGPNLDDPFDQDLDAHGYQEP